jgi:hypothetical protein
LKTVRSRKLPNQRAHQAQSRSAGSDRKVIGSGARIPDGVVVDLFASAAKSLAYFTPAEYPRDVGSPHLVSSFFHSLFY